MTWLQIIVLAVIQGLTEFLPISSSGHLVLAPIVFGWQDQGLTFDIAVHFGSLIAVCIYFRHDIYRLLGGALQVVRGDLSTDYARLAAGLAIATVPAAAAGLLFAGWIEANLRSPSVVVITLAGFAVLMILADRFGSRTREFSSMTIRDAFLIGLAQSLALIPGTSRSGATITAALALGLKRHDAARFSFVLSVPVILLATGYKGISVALGDAPVDWLVLAVAAAVSAVVAYISIDFFMRFVNAIGLLPFAIYRLILAGAIVYVLM
jgi:undecaprenyl-diphosphatase